MPVFSIIVPIYNVEQYLPKCVLSVLEQDFDDYELILVDDGSPDNCGKIADDYAKIDARIKVIHKQNEGLVRARNSGLLLATGDYVVNVDGDDYLLPDSLGEIYKYIKKSHADVYCFGFHMQKGNGYSVVLPNCPEGLYEGNSKDKLYENMIYDKASGFFTFGIYPCVWSRVVKRELFTDIRLSVESDIVIGEDFATTLPVMLSADSIYIISKPFYYYRIIDDSLSHKFDPRELQYYAIMLKWVETCEYFDISKYKIKYQLGAYTVDVVYNNLVKYIKKAESYKDFKLYIRNIEKIIFKYTKLCKYSFGSLKGIIIPAIIKNRLWYVLWIFKRRKNNER